MSLALHWFLPTTGDGRDVVGAHVGARGRVAAAATRPPDAGYLRQVALAADGLGFEGVLTPTGTWCEDAWITSAALAAATTRLRFIVAVRPSSVSPTAAAQMACTLSGVSAGRVDLNVVTGGDTADLRRFGDWLGHDERYARTDEFLTVLRGAWSGVPADFDGAHYRVEGATVARAPSTPPRIFFGGASEAAARVSARHADVHVAWAEPPAGVAEQLDLVRGHSGLRDPGAAPLAFGLRVHVITRETADEAWAVADRLLAHLDPRDVASAQERFAGHESEGQRRMNRLHSPSRNAGSTKTAGVQARPLEVSPNLWAGFGLVRPRAGTALVGSHDEVADRLAEYHDLGVSHVILSGQPHLEEAYAVAEGLRPALAARGLS